MRDRNKTVAMAWCAVKPQPWGVRLLSFCRLFSTVLFAIARTLWKVLGHSIRSQYPDMSTVGYSRNLSHEQYRFVHMYPVDTECNKEFRGQRSVRGRCLVRWRHLESNMFFLKEIAVLGCGAWWSHTVQTVSVASWAGTRSTPVLPCLRLSIVWHARALAAFFGQGSEPRTRWSPISGLPLPEHCVSIFSPSPANASSVCRDHIYSGILGQREIFHKRDKYSTKERGRNGDEGEIFKVREKFSEGEIFKVNKIFWTWAKYFQSGRNILILNKTFYAGWTNFKVGEIFWQ